MAKLYTFTAKKITLLFCLIGLWSIVSAQTSIFSRQFKSAGTDVSVITHIATLDGGTLELVDQRKISDGTHYMDLLKADAQGNLQWTKRFGPLLFGLKNVVQSPDGSYFLCFTQNPFGHFYEMIKLDANGTVLFDKRVNFPAVSRVGIFPMSIARNDGGYYVACSITDTTTYVTQWNLFSLDASGNLLWSNAYNADTWTMEVTTVDTCSNGDIVLAGTYYDLTQQKYEMIITRVSSAGALLWTKKYVSAGVYDFYPREITHKGNDIVLAAIAYNNATVSSSVVLIKMDNAGAIGWSYRYANSVRQLDPFDILPVEDGNLAITGTAFTPNIASFFLKVDSFGLVFNGRVYMNWNMHTVQNVNGYQYSISGSYNDSIYPQAAYMTTDINGTGCADAALTITRSPISFTVTNGSGFQSFPFTIGTGTTPSPVPVYVGDDICRITGISSHDHPSLTAVDIFPSPASDWIHIVSAETISRIELIDVNGKIVVGANPDASSCTIDGKELSSGIYLVKVYTPGEIQFRKVIIQHL